MGGPITYPSIRPRTWTHENSLLGGLKSTQVNSSQLKSSKVKLVSECKLSGMYAKRACVGNKNDNAAACMWISWPSLKSSPMKSIIDNLPFWIEQRATSHSKQEFVIMSKLDLLWYTMWFPVIIKAGWSSFMYSAPPLSLSRYFV
jgi:hypothetical protein